MKARIIAFYLPQLHEIPENNEWWGKGFTEWVSVKNGIPLFKGHNQPNRPGELGYYNLLDEITRMKQAELAKEAGIEGFCYWHYWFGNGRELLEKPFNLVLESGQPDFPFCLGWANHTWSRKTWTKFSKEGSQLLVEQEYPGEIDNILHFNKLLPAFKDRRYITVDGKPLFLIWDSMGLPNQKSFFEIWNKMAKENGLPGIHFVGLKGGPIHSAHSPLTVGYDAVCWENFYSAELKASWWKTYMLPKLHRFVESKWLLKKYKYQDIISNFFTDIDKEENIYPSIVANYDRSPRGGKKAVIFYDSTPNLFKQHLLEAIDCIKHKDEQHRILFLRSWNEWGEGNYIEPDEKWGKAYLNVIREVLNQK